MLHNYSKRELEIKGPVITNRFAIGLKAFEYYRTISGDKGDVLHEGADNLADDTGISIYKPALRTSLDDLTQEDVDGMIEEIVKEYINATSVNDL